MAKSIPIAYDGQVMRPLGATCQQRLEDAWQAHASFGHGCLQRPSITAHIFHLHQVGTLYETLDDSDRVLRLFMWHPYQKAVASLPVATFS